MRGAWLSLVLVAFAASIAATQQPTTSPLPLADLPDADDFEQLNNEDGLSQVSVSAMLQDGQGFLWFGTSDGLNRFNGYEFEIFYHEPDDPGSLSHRRIRSLYESPEGGLWIGTDGGGLNYLDPATRRFSHARHDPDDPRSLSHDVVLAITLDRAGVLWIGTAGGLDRLDGGDPRRFSHWRHDPEDPGSLSNPRVNDLLEDREGRLWVATHGGLDRLDAERQEIGHFRHRPAEPDSLAHPAVYTLAEDRLGNLWVGTSGGLDRLTSTGRFVHHRPEPSDLTSPRNDIRSIVPDGHGRMWIGTQGGLFLFDPLTRDFHAVAFDPAPSLSKLAVASMMLDRSGALWLGTWIAGLYRHDPGQARFEHFFHRPEDPGSLSSDTVYAFAEGRDGGLWVGTVGGGLDYMEPGSRSFVHYRHDPSDPESLASHFVRCLLVDRRGNLWIGTADRGLDRLPPSRDRFFHYPHSSLELRSPSHDQVISLLEDRSGAVWVGTRGGLDRYDAENDDFEHHDLFVTPEDAAERSAINRRIMALLEDREGNLWSATRRGLYRYDRLRVTRYAHDPDDPSSLSHDDVWSLLEDTTGILWIGTGGGGLNRLDPRTGRFRYFTAADGLGNNSVYAVLQDSEGRLWISTNRGLVRFDPTSEQWLRYDFQDGLQGIEFNLGAALRARDGTLYFGGVNGFNAFEPTGFRDNPHVPPVVVTSFEVLGRGSLLDWPTSGGRAFELDHDEGFFSFEFAALNYTRPDKNHYAYQLEGLDEDWVEVGTRRFASYTNVPPGRYTFRVKGSNNDGLWNQSGASLAIVIVPPWWQTPWAYGAYVLAALALVTGAVFSQRRKLERERAITERERAINADLEAKNAELERFTYTVSHDLKNPLVTIKNYLGFVRQKVEVASDERLSQDLDRIERAAWRMQQMIEELLELSRIGRVVHPPEVIDLFELAHEAVDHLSGALAADEIDVIVAPDLPQVYGDRLRILEVLEILIENAAKFMGDQAKPRIEIGSRETSGEPVIFVRDNGIGIEPPYHERIFGLFERLDPKVDGTGIGLALAQRIVEAHRGRCWVESAGEGQGSTFCFTLADFH